jgi:hypothetical protein
MLGNLIPMHVNFGQPYQLHDFSKALKLIFDLKLATIRIPSPCEENNLDINGRNTRLDNVV